MIAQFIHGWLNITSPVALFQNVVLIIVQGEVHNVFGRSPGTMINNGGTSITANMYTYEIIIELADQTKTEPLFSKDNLDFFICYQYKSNDFCGSFPI